MSQAIKSQIAIFAAGLLFGLGLVISGMVNPRKVIGFLDIAGDWDPSLALVMGGGLLVTVPAFRWVLRMPQPLLEDKFYLPKLSAIDGKLVLGAVLFGVGWGIAGFCPGPALTALASLDFTVVLFVLAMIGGMVLHQVLLS